MVAAAQASLPTTRSTRSRPASCRNRPSCRFLFRPEGSAMTDHNSSPRAVAEPAIDIADMYVFPSPSRPGQLVIVMTVFPNARPGALFSDAVSYRFRVRPATVPATVPASRFEIGTEEYDITCTFAAPVNMDDAQEGKCTLPN